MTSKDQPRIIKDQQRSCRVQQGLAMDQQWISNGLASTSKYQQTDLQGLAMDQQGLAMDQQVLVFTRTHEDLLLFARVLSAFCILQLLFAWVLSSITFKPIQITAHPQTNLLKPMHITTTKQLEGANVLAMDQGIAMDLTSNGLARTSRDGKDQPGLAMDQQ